MMVRIKKSEDDGDDLTAEQVPSAADGLCY